LGIRQGINHRRLVRQAQQHMKTLVVAD